MFRNLCCNTEVGHDSMRTKRGMLPHIINYYNTVQNVSDDLKP